MEWLKSRNMMNNVYMGIYLHNGYKYFTVSSWTTLLCLETYPVPALSALLATYTSVVWYTASE